MNLRYFVLLTALLILKPVSAQVEESPEITVDELKAYVTFLASDELAGRKTGSEGEKLAAEYIRDNLKSHGLTPLYENGFQRFGVTLTAEIGPDNRFAVGDFYPMINKDYIPFSYSENEAAEAEVVFAGYGFKIDTDSLKWNDFSDMDVSGKWVMILRGAPSEEAVFDFPSMLRTKIINTKDNGAAGILIVQGKEFDSKDELVDISFGQREPSVGLPVIHIKREVADFILKSKNKTVEGLEKELIESFAPATFNTGAVLDAAVDIVRKKKDAINVAFMLEGNDPALKDEYIVVGAHYDHLGMGGPGSGSRRPDELAPHNGADDNASGVASVMEIAEKFAANKDELKRSIIFVFFSGEEMGLLGSKHFVYNLPVEKEKVRFFANLDMVGMLDEDESITIGGVGTAEGLDDIIDENLKNTELSANKTQEGYGPSDHSSFYANDISVLFFFTGAHEYYHTPEDDAFRLNYEGQKLVTGAVYDIVRDINMLEGEIVYKEAGPKSNQTGRKRFKVTLGIVPDVAASDINGLRVDAVIDGRPASKAGMEKGDIIVAIDGKPVGDVYEYMTRLSELKAGEIISVDVMRDDKKVVLIVEL